MVYNTKPTNFILFDPLVFTVAQNPSLCIKFYPYENVLFGEKTCFLRIVVSLQKNGLPLLLLLLANLSCFLLSISQIIATACFSAIAKRVAFAICNACNNVLVHTSDIPPQLRYFLKTQPTAFLHKMKW